jgi:hypothetical protein
MCASIVAGQNMQEGMWHRLISADVLSTLSRTNITQAMISTDDQSA